MDRRISEIDWNKETPDFIDPPRVWRRSSFSKIDEKYIGISLNYVLTPGGQEGDVYWTYTDNITKLVLDNAIDFIYKKDEDKRYALFMDAVDEMRSTCPDCNGTCEYIGFTVREPCPTCNGNGKV